MGRELESKAGLELQFQAGESPRLGKVGANPRGHMTLGSQQPARGRKRGSGRYAEPQQRGLGVEKRRLLRLTTNLDDNVLVLLCLDGGEATYVSAQKDGSRRSTEHARSVGGPAGE